jgi:hypothetical protein
MWYLRARSLKRYRSRSPLVHDRLEAI